jgi:RNA polymerase sigma-70 factor, ECF subfamily
LFFLVRVGEALGMRQSEFEQVAIPHTRSLLRVARRLTLDTAVAEDLVQDTLLLAWRNFGQFRAGTNARAWLFRIMFNVFYGEKRKVRSAPPLVSLEVSGRERELPGRAVSSALDAAVVADALDHLSIEHRAVLLLGVVEGLSCREMADVLAVPIGTVMSRLSRARQSLRGYLLPDCADTSEDESGARFAGKDAGKGAI